MNEEQNRMFMNSETEFGADYFYLYWHDVNYPRWDVDSIIASDNLPRMNVTQSLMLDVARIRWHL